MLSVGVVGGGLAGLSVAEALLRRGASVALYDDNDVLRGSNASTALLHPFAGRSFRPKVYFHEAFVAARGKMERILASHTPTVKRLRMVRPLAGAGAERLEESYRKYWLDESSPFAFQRWGADELRTRLPELEGLDRAITYEPGYAVDLMQALRQRTMELQEEGLIRRETRIMGLHFDGEGWLMVDTSGRKYRCTHLVVCPGRGLMKFFPELPCVLEGGELGHQNSAGGAKELATILNGMHVVPSPRGGRVVGSTRWRLGTDEDWPSHHGKRRLLDAARKRLPHFAIKDFSEVWSGVRVVCLPDRLPLVGPHPTLDKTWVLGALGSTGLFWSTFCAELLAESLWRKRPIPNSLSTLRLPTDAWNFSNFFSA